MKKGEDKYMKKAFIGFWTLLFVGSLYSGDLVLGTKAVTSIMDTGHHVQVWEVSGEFTFPGTYVIEARHAAAGPKGSFFITAWADTDNNGVPDKEIGRSERKQAKKAGDWSSWEFQSDYKRIFVGYTWDQSDEQVYYQSEGKNPGYTGLSSTVFYSRNFNGVPNQSTSPRYTNIIVTFQGNSRDFGTVGREVSDIVDTGHHIQVWKVDKDMVKSGYYRISVKHGAAGPTGSFYITAWADTDNDGKPDREITRSPLMTAKKTGEWSSWDFSTKYSSIFVGDMWDQSDEKVYYQSGGTLEGYTGLSSTIFYSRTFDGIPDQSTGPRFTNIRVSVQ